MGSYNDTEVLESLKAGTVITNETVTRPPMFFPIFNVDFLMLLVSLAIGIFWITYITYYHSRIQGYILTKLLGRFVHNGYLSVGSFSLSVLSGKVMFRELVYTTEDFTVRIRDGWLIFKYWSGYVSRELAEDMSHAKPRLLVQINGLEVHAYNRMDRYRAINELFKLHLFNPLRIRKPRSLASFFGSSATRSTSISSGGGAGVEGGTGAGGSSSHRQPAESSATTWTRIWRSLIPVIKIDISYGRIVIGNHLLPSTLVCSWENADMFYSSKPPSNAKDVFMHVVKGRCENAKVAFVKSSGYMGFYEPPPRIMGDGFVILQTAVLDYYFYMDELGIVDEGSTQDSAANLPCLGTDLRLGKGTVISYGPWADRQREKLYNWFFPNDYQPMLETKFPIEGQKRIYTSFDLKISTVNDATLDVLYTKNDVTDAVHINFNPGSYCEINVPWVIGEDGYATTILGQLMRVDSSCSLPYRSLIESETLEFSCELTYPRIWSDLLEWHFSLVTCRTTFWFVYRHKEFLKDLLNDWSSSEMADLYGFVPYKWIFGLTVKEFELILCTNDYNWIDTSSQSASNYQLALCGDSLCVSFVLPFTEFLPSTVDFNFKIEAEGLILKMYLPESSVLREPMLSLLANSGLPLGSGSSNCRQFFSNGLKWSSWTSAADSWMECWCAPLGGSLHLNFKQHPIPVPYRSRYQQFQPASATIDSFDPDKLAPDVISLVLELAPSVLILNGALVKQLVNVKDNYIGEYQEFSELPIPSVDSPTDNPYGHVDLSGFDAGEFRPLSVQVSAKLHSIHAHALTYKQRDAVACPQLFIEQLVFEMDKRFRETMLQVCVSPASILFAGENRSSGQIFLSGLQLRGNAMFSDEELPVDSPTLEYGWLMELMLGDLTGSIKAGHLLQLISFLNTFRYQVDSNEDGLPQPEKLKLCQHMNLCSLCDHGNPPSEPCLTEHVLKYRMIRVSIDQVILSIAEPLAILETQISNLRLSHCNMHSKRSKGGVSVFFPELTVRQFAKADTCSTNSTGKKAGQRRTSAESGAAGKSATLLTDDESKTLWLECATLNLKHIDLKLALPSEDRHFSFLQKTFLFLHDKKTKRLEFLWNQDDEVFRCSCMGGSRFFGVNSNGRILFRPESFRQKLAIPTVLDVSNANSFGFWQSILSIDRLVLSPVAESPKIIVYQQSSDSTDDTTTHEDFFDTKESFPPTRASSISVSSHRVSDRDDSLSEGESFLSTASAAEEVFVNLRGQLTRPVFDCHLLMRSYAKHLSVFECTQYAFPALLAMKSSTYARQTKMKQSDGQAPTSWSDFKLYTPGINSITLSQKSRFTASRPSQEPRPSNRPDPGESIRTQMQAAGCGPDGDPNFSQLEVLLKSDYPINLFVTPLAVDLLGLYVTILADSIGHQNPIKIVEDCLRVCSATEHTQLITGKDHKDVKVPLPPLQLFLNFPQINFVLFESGIIEKVVPIANLSMADALISSSAFVFVADNIQAHTTSVGATSPRSVHLNTELAAFEGAMRKPNIIIGAAKVDDVHFQLLQLCDETYPSIGISPSSTKIPVATNYNQLRKGNEHANVIAEGSLITLNCLFEYALAQASSKETPTSTTSEPGSPIFVGNKASAEKISASGVAESPTSNKSGSTISGHYSDSISVDVDQVLINCGLCVPVDEASESWPLFDILSPSLNAWLHVSHRLSYRLRSMNIDYCHWKRIGLSYMLAACWANPQVFSGAPKGGAVKQSKGGHFDDCPSCLLLSTVFRVSSLPMEYHQLGEDVMNDLNFYAQPQGTTGDHYELALQALYAMFAIYQMKLLHAKLVQLSRMPRSLLDWLQHEHATSRGGTMESDTKSLSEVSVAAAGGAAETAFLLSPGKEDRDVEAGSTLEELSPLLKPNDPANLKGMMDKLQDLSNRRQSVLEYAKYPTHHRASLASINLNRSSMAKSTPDATAMAHGHPSSSIASAGGGTKRLSRQHSAALAEVDLYQWMAKQQETHQKLKAKPSSAEKERMTLNTNDNLISMLELLPTDVFFESIYRALTLETGRPYLPSLIDDSIHRLAFSFSLESFEATIVEPKILKHLNSNLQSVSHTERPFFTLSDFALSLEMSKQNERQHVVKENALTVNCSRDVNYHAHLRRFDCTFGFPTATLLNQLAFVARTTMDTFNELDQRSSPVDEPNPFASLSKSIDSGSGADPSIPSVNESFLFDLDQDSVDCLMNDKSKYTRFTRRFRRQRSAKDAEDGRDSSSPPSKFANTKNTEALLLDIVKHFASEARARIMQKGPKRLISIPRNNDTVTAVTFGVLDISEIQLQATMTELAVFSTIYAVQMGHSDKTKMMVQTSRVMFNEMSVTSALKRVVVNLQEGGNPDVQTVARLFVEQSQFLFTKILKRPSREWKNSLLIEIGPVSIDIPLNPGILHGVVVRSTHKIADTLKDLKTPQVVEEIEIKRAFDPSFGEYSRQLSRLSESVSVNFCIIMRSMCVSAALLPSLKAIYQMDQATSSGITGMEAKFFLELPKHKLTFDVRGLAVEKSGVTPTIDVSLPPLMAQGAYIPDVSSSGSGFKDGGYLKVDAEVGVFQHTLTTDLLNQLLFIEEAFMRELGEIIQKVTSEKKPKTFWISSTTKDKLLYSVDTVIKNIQITATTPTSTAVRLEAESVKFQFSNRLVEVSNPEKTFGMAEIKLNVALGQLVKDALFEEVAPDFQRFAYFKTDIILRNAPSSVANEIEGSTAYLISLSSPSIFILPTAIDKAILLWLNYKNAYDFWSDQRQQLRAKSPRKDKAETKANVFEQLGSPNFPSASPLFLQVKVEKGIYICMPLYSAHYSGVRAVEDSCCALIVSLEDTGIAVCTYGAMVSNGRFKGFCVTIVDNFDPAAENWRPDLESRNMKELNCCYVPEGTYKVCSKTIAPTAETPNAEWILNVEWQMQGVDVNLNTMIGKSMSLLVSTLTSLTGDEEDRIGITSEKASMEPRQDYSDATESSDLMSVLGDISQVESSSESSSKGGMGNVERAMHQQARLVYDLQQLGANEATIEGERRKLQILESFLFRQFRSDMRQKLRKQSQRATSLKDRFGLAGPLKEGTGKARRLPIQRKFSHSSSERELVEKRRKMHVRTTSFDAQMPSPIEEEPDRLSIVSNPPDSRSSSWDLSSSNLQTPASDEDNLPAFDFSSTPRFMTAPSSTLTSASGHVELSPSATEIFPSSRSHVGKTSKASRFESPPTTTVSAQSATAATLEPAVNLYLDFRIYVESGKCTLRTNETSEEGEAKRVQRHDRLRPGKSGGGIHTPSWKLGGRGGAQMPNVTIIAIPGLNVKTFYTSRSGVVDESSMSDQKLCSDTLRAASPSYLSDEVINHILSSNKKAQFCMWLSLESMPVETEISPHILDFLEQTLEPLSSSQKISLRSFSYPQPQPGSLEKMMSEPGLPDGTGEFNRDNSALQWDVAMMPSPVSFPVDVLVYISVQSSALRFTSAPYSIVQCLVKLPALSLVATSRKSAEVLIPQKERRHLLFESFDSVPGTSQKSVQEDDSIGQPHKISDDNMLSGGISVTACLSDFSLYIFHPYGTAATVSRSGNFADAERKDSFSLQVTSVVVNISRSRNIISLDSSGPSKLGTLTSSASLENSVRFSLLVDFGTATFIYDMRRLNEILSFPRAWYRRAMMRRFFLGDESGITAKGTHSVSSLGSGVGSFTTGSDESKLAADRLDRKRLPPMDDNQSSAFSSPKKEEPGRPESTSHSDSGENLTDQRPVTTTPPTLAPPSSVVQNQSSQDKGKWTALVLYFVNFSELSIQTNMGNTMGKTTWVLKEAHSQGRLAVDSRGNKKLQVSMALGSSVLDSKSGMVGGNISLANLKLFGKMKEVPGREPQHELGASLASSEVKLEWMGTTIFMGWVTQLNMDLRDDWKLLPSPPPSASLDSSGETSNLPQQGVEDGAMYFCGDVRWEQLQIMISRTTVTDLVKIVNRLIEFFQNEFKSGKRMFLAPSSKRSGVELLLEGSETEESEEKTSGIRHHRHWQKPMDLISHLLLSMKFPFPTRMSLGGSLDFGGKEIALACFHGTNFRAHKWAVFHMRNPMITFSSEARDLVVEGRIITNICEDLSFNLGVSPTIQELQINRSMAYVLQVQRGPYVPPQVGSIHEWFDYTFGSVFSAVYGKDYEFASINDRQRSSRDYKHDIFHLFRFPVMQLHLKTKHSQGQDEPGDEDDIPVVDCCFVSDFNDHVYVCMDAVAYAFLNDLIKSYMNEGKTGRNRPDDVPGVSKIRKASSTIPNPTATELQKDARQFICDHWTLEPTIRVIDMPNIEGVDYLLQKLGFQHARTTIPKWIQRGFMDPLDSVLAHMVELLIILSRKKT